MRSNVFLITHLKAIVTELGYTWPENTIIEPPREKKFGDLACNCAMLLAKLAGKNPRELATTIAQKLKEASYEIADVSVAGPGFLNITLIPGFWQKNIVLVEKAGNSYGSSDVGGKTKVQVEFVSANPTGPLHIGHGRGAAIGDTMARILKFNGYDVVAEYYINDAGKQMRTLGASVWKRALELEGKLSEPFPEDHYQGHYIINIAKKMLIENPNLTSAIPEEGINACYEYGMKIIFDGIKKDLKDFRVHHDVWFSELSLTKKGKVEETLNFLKVKGYADEHDGALWFRTTELGDDKDRVLRKTDGSLTYFASDIAYHADKFERGFKKIIDIWGADHHGYIPRMKAAISALEQKEDSFNVLLVQLVNLLRDGAQVAMSTRAGEFVTLEDVVSEVGTDAARFMFLSRKSDSKLDFDLSLVKQRTMDNPVYYVQYAHARICTLLKRAAERELSFTEDADISLLVEPEELDLLKIIGRFPSIVSDAATNLSPHFISYYLMEFSGLLHKYYAMHQVLAASSQSLIFARLRLLKAAGQTIRNGLELLGVSAPESM